jgi:hypothetical protein
MAPTVPTANYGLVWDASIAAWRPGAVGRNIVSRFTPITAVYDNPVEMGGTGADIGYQKMGNGIVGTYLGYRTTPTQYAFFEGVLDKDWDASSLTAILRWYTTSPSTNQVVWKLYGARYSNGATRDMTLSTLLATIAQSNQGALYQNVSAETSAFSLNGSDRNFVLMLTRDHAGESPALAAEARFLSLEVYGVRL